MSTHKLTPAQLLVLRSLAKDSLYRPRYDVAHRLIRAGLVERCSVEETPTNGGNLYWLTDAGKAALRSALGEPALREFRCTRRMPYRNPTCPGHKDLTARQGYYVNAPTAALAEAEMRASFPHDAEGFDVEDVEHLKGSSTICDITRSAS